MIYWLPTYLAREDPKLEVLDAKTLTREINSSKPVNMAELNEKLVKKLRQHQKDGDILIFMGAGNIDGWAREFASNLDN